MHLLSSQTRPSGEIPSSSMADIAFLLLVFFMVTTVFPRDQGLTIALPEAVNHPLVDRANLLQIFVSPDGWVEVRRGGDSMAQRMRAAELERLWRTESALNPLLIADLRTANDAPYHRMIRALDALKQAGAKRISLRAAEEGR